VNASHAQPRRRAVRSVAEELIKKSRESALSAIQTYNNPLIRFKSETFIVLMVIAWTYLLHAYYRKKGVDYRYWTLVRGQKRYDRTRVGAYKNWELLRCLDCGDCPVDKDTANNLRFLIGIRNEIEHQMTSRIDSYIEARLQACCLNYNEYLMRLIGEKSRIDTLLPHSLQLSTLTKDQADTLRGHESLPRHIRMFIAGFDGSLSDEEFNSPRFAYRVYFVAKTANRRGQADEVIEFIDPKSPEAQTINHRYMLIKEVERPKYLAGAVVKIMRNKGFNQFNMHCHTQLWKSMEAKEPGKGFGTLVGKTWYWYESWVVAVERHCSEQYRQ